MNQRLRRGRSRRGMLLPLVLVAMLLVFSIAASLHQVAWRASRGAHSQWDAQRGTYMADAAVVRAIAGWRADSAAATPIGTPRVNDASAAGGWRTRTTTMRTGPLRAVILSVARRDRAAGTADVDAARTKRVVVRVVSLSPPTLPFLGAATLLGPVTVGASLVDGRDVLGRYDAARDDCGPRRDTTSIAAISAQSIATMGAPRLQGAALVASPAQLISARAQFDSGFALLQARATTIPLTPGSAVPPYPEWRAVVIRDTGGVTLSGASTHVGLLAFDGDLTLRGTLEVEGLLLIRGALNASQGALTVRGALMVRDPAVRGSTMGDGVDARYAPCLVGRALAAVAVPRPARFSLWNSP